MIITLKCIMTLLEEKPGKRMSNCFIARKLGGHPTNTIAMINELVVMGRLRKDDSSRTTLFYAPTEQDIRAEEYVQYVAPAKPYKQVGAAWDRVAERIADFRALPSLIRRPS